MKGSNPTYPHEFNCDNEEDELGFSNWMTPSRGTPSSPTETVLSSAEKGGAGERGLLGSAPASALAKVRRVFEVLLEEEIVDLWWEKSGGFGLAVRRGDERGGLLAERALQGAWVRCNMCVSGEHELITGQWILTLIHSFFLVGKVDPTNKI